MSWRGQCRQRLPGRYAGVDPVQMHASSETRPGYWVDPVQVIGRHPDTGPDSEGDLSMAIIV